MVVQWIKDWTPNAKVMSYNSQLFAFVNMAVLSWSQSLPEMYALKAHTIMINKPPHDLTAFWALKKICTDPCSRQKTNSLPRLSPSSQIPNRTWYLAQFKHFLTHNFGREAAEVAFQNMEAAIVQTLLVAESSLAAHFGAFTTHPWEDHYR